MTVARAMLATAALVACGPSSAVPRPAVSKAAPTSAPRAVTPSVHTLTATRWPDVALPRSTATRAVPTGIPIVVVSKTAIRIDGDPPVVQLPADRTHGVDAKYKSGSPDLLVGPLAEALRTKRASEVALVFDATTPYRLVTEVMYTAGQSELTTFHLIVSQNGVLADLRIPPPRAAGPGALLDPARHLSFLVILGADGIALKTRGGNIAPGCKELGPGITVPKKSGAYDFDSLRACATLLRESNPESDADHGVTLSANPDIAFGDMIQAIDRVRVGNDGQPLFPDLSFGIVR